LIGFFHQQFKRKLARLARRLAQEQPKLSPQLRHLKQAPLRTVRWPQAVQAGASSMKCATDWLIAEASWLCECAAA
jgi:uncharacterized protein HemX